MSWKINRKSQSVLAAGILILGCSSVFAVDHGDVQHRSRNIHSGNLIRTTWYNHDMMGGQKNDQSLKYGGEWPINSGMVQMGNTSGYISTEFNIMEIEPIDSVDTHLTSFTPVVFSEGWDPEMFSHDQFGRFQGFEPIGGYFNPDNPELLNKAAMSHQTITWPESWPDKMSDGNDPGWAGKWNGYFGKNVMSADQESYSATDDYQFDKSFTGFYNLPVQLPLPDENDVDRRGLGVQKSFRGLQWSNPDAEDVIFWIYDIQNIGNLRLNKCVFGLNVGASIGARLGSNTDYGDDSAKFDRESDLTLNYDWDNIGTGGYTPVPSVGFAFLESPGNPFDYIDNDGDGLSSPAGGHVLSASDLTNDIAVGDPIVLIDYNDTLYARTVTTMPDTGIVITFQNQNIRKYPGFTPENPHNGIDDNLNGIIDEADQAEIGETGETYFLYIEQSIDYLAKNAITLEGMTNLLIDERRDDGIDNDGDWDPENDDVGIDGLEETGDEGENDGIPTFGTSELPGEPHTDVVDVKEADQIGLTSFVFYEYASITYSNDQQMWSVSQPGYFDGRLENVDADYIFSSGYFPMMPDDRIGFSVGMIYGFDTTDVILNKEIVQKIYDANYNYAVAPKLPTVWAVPGDGRVTLYWDDLAELSKDRYLNEYDFEGYKIYRSTDPGFNDEGHITDGYGYDRSVVPIAIFDKINEVSGFFPESFGHGVQFNLGSETGLVHSYVDSNLINGMRYFYAVTAYDRGDVYKSISPSETSKYVTLDATGKVETAQNVVVVTPSAPSVGYHYAGLEQDLMSVGDNYFGEGYIELRIAEQDLIVSGQQFELQFLDEAMDYRDNDGNGLIDLNDPMESLGLHATAFVLNEINGTDDPVPLDTMWFQTYRTNHEPFEDQNNNDMWDADEPYTDENSNDEFDYGEPFEDINNDGVYNYAEPYIDDNGNGVFDSAIYDDIINLYEDEDYEVNPYTLTARSNGFEFLLYNPPAGIIHDPENGIDNGIRWSWNINPENTYPMGFRVYQRNPETHIPGTFVAHQYMVVFDDELIGMSDSLYIPKYEGLPKLYRPTPTNFRVYDLATCESAYVGCSEVPYGFSEDIPPMTITPVPDNYFNMGDNIFFFEEVESDTGLVTFHTMHLENLGTLNSDQEFVDAYGRWLSSGDTLYLYSSTEYNSSHRFEFVTEAESIDTVYAGVHLDEIKVVPNPYVAAAMWESSNPYTSGRGPRLLKFTHLPPRCTIRIYSVDGTLVRKLEHDKPFNDGSEDWDMLTLDNMDIAYGMYIYHVDAPGIGTHVGKFLVIK